MVMDDKTIDALFKAYESVRKTSYGEGPQYAYHPDFGWIIWDGKPTESSEAFKKFLEEKESTGR